MPTLSELKRLANEVIDVCMDEDVLEIADVAAYGVVNNPDAVYRALRDYMDRANPASRSRTVADAARGAGRTVVEVPLSRTSPADMRGTPRPAARPASASMPSDERQARVDEILRRRFGHLRPTDKDERRAADAAAKCDRSHPRGTRDWRRAYIALALTQRGRITNADKTYTRGLDFASHVPVIKGIFHRKAAFLSGMTAEQSGWSHGATCTGTELREGVR